MKPKSRNILLILGAIAFIFVGTIGYGLYSVYSFFSQFSTTREIPDEIKDAKTLVGSEFLTKTVFFHQSRDGLVKTIGDGTKVKDEKERQKMVQSEVAKGIYNFADLKLVDGEIVAVGEFGGYFFDLNGDLKRHMAFDPVVVKVKIGPYEQETYQNGLSNLQIVQLERNKLGFLSYGSTEGVRVFDENGNQIWSTGSEEADLSILFRNDKERESEYEKKTYVLRAAVGDLDNDGISEYIVARKKDGVRAYDQRGSEKWFQPADFPNEKLDIRDLDGDGKNELLEIGNSVLDGSGKFVRKLGGGESFLFVDGKDRGLSIESIQIDDGLISLSDENGVNLFSSKAPLSEIKKEARKVDVPGHPELSYVDDTERVVYPKAVLVQLQKGKPKYLAVVASFIGIPRANLYVFELNGNLVYHELLDEEAETIAGIPSAEEGKEQLLVGGKESIWRYAAN